MLDQPPSILRDVSLVCGDEDIRRTVQDLLRTQRLRVRHFYTGAEYLRAHDSGGDCLIVDLCLPDMNGLELLNRQAFPSMPVIVLAGNRDVRGAVSAMRAGAADVVERSRLSRDLMGRVRETFASLAPHEDRADGPEPCPSNCAD